MPVLVQDGAPARHLLHPLGEGRVHQLKVSSGAGALVAVNDAKYGLQTGVFTRDVQAAFRAHRALEVGGVVIG